MVRKIGASRTSSVLLIALAVIVALVTTIPAYAEDYGSTAASEGINIQSTGDFANVVIIARFADDTTGDGETGYNAPNAYNTSYTEYDRFRAAFDQATGYFGNTYSLAKYLSDASGGQSVVRNYFPQASADGHTTQYVTLPKTQAQYQAQSNPEYAMVSDAIRTFDGVYDGTTGGWDADGDGSIDNLDIIVQVNEDIPVENQMLWPHKYNLGIPSGCSINGMNVNIYNVVNSEAVGNGATMAHEFLHSMGLGDLYRLGALTTEAGFEGANTPVGIWDIMAKAGFELPLAQSRQDLGWGDIPEVDESGSYTLTKAWSETGRNAFKVASPYSSDEYFVFEYRNKPTDQIAAMTTPDKYIPNSGLIVYRVNNSFGEKNNKSYDNSGSYYRDYLYVFRPGETGIHASAGNTMEACLSLGDDYAPAGNGTQYSSFGSDNASDPISAGTICDSLGRNSMIQVELTAQDDGSVTFDLTLGETADIDMWNQVGGFDTAASGYLASAVGDDGTLYVIDQDLGAGFSAGKYNVKAFASDGAVNDMGAPFATQGGKPMIAVDDGVVYCAVPLYPGGGNNSVAVKKYVGSQWVTVGNVSTGTAYANTPTMSVVDGQVYLLVDKDNNNAQLYKVGDSISAVGSPLTGKYLLGPSLASLDGSVIVAYGDYDMGSTSNSALRVAKLSGSTWQALGSNAGATRVTSMTATDDGKVLLLERADCIAPRLFTIDGQGLGAPIVVSGPTSSVDNGMGVATQGEWTYVMVSQPDDGLGIDVARVWASKTDDLTSWQKVGEDAVAPSSAASFAVTADTLYVVSENSNTYKGTVAGHDVLESTQPPVEEPEKIDIPTAVSGLVYIGREQQGVQAAEGFTVTGGSATAAGSHSAVAALDDKDGTVWSDGTTEDKNISWSIAKASLNASYVGETITFGQTPVLSVTVTGFVNGETAATAAGYTAPTLGAPNPQTVGTFRLAPAGGQADNYSFSYTAGNLVVNAAAVVTPKTIAIPSAASNLVYNGKVQSGVTLPSGCTVKSGSVSGADIGDYSAVLSLTDPVATRWSDGSTSDKTVTWSIGAGNYVKDADALNCGSKGGAYTMASKLGPSRLVDISGRSSVDGGNAQMYQGNETPAQHFYFSFIEVNKGYGYYKIQNVYSGKVLDVSGGATYNTANVQQWTWNGTEAQQWAITKSASSGYFALVNIGSGKVLDITWANPWSGANLQIYESNGTAAQQFRITSCRDANIDASSAYYLKNVMNASRAVDVVWASKDDCGNIQLYDWNKTKAQQFTFKYDEATGYYTITNVGSKKVVDTTWGGDYNGVNIQQYTSNGTWAQKWAVRHSGGSYTFFCACSGRCFDLQWGSTANGSNIQCWEDNGTLAQRWTIQKV